MYGDVELNKEECINHVAKRLGTELGKLASSGKKAGSINRGYDKLTQATIVKLTAYYRKAVRADPNNLGTCGRRCGPHLTMRHRPTRIVARWELTAGDSTFYQKSLAAGQQPGPHRTNEWTPLSVDVAKHAKEIYEHLLHADLLTRCLRRKTQNPNESLH